MFYVNIFFSPQVQGFVTAMLEILARSIISSHSLSTVLLLQWPKEQTPDITNSLHTKYSVFNKTEFTIYFFFFYPLHPSLLLLNRYLCVFVLTFPSAFTSGYPYPCPRRFTVV